MKKVPLHSIGVQFVIHATEDADKTLVAIADVLGIGREHFSLTRLSGYFGNPVLYYKSLLEGANALGPVRLLFSNLNALYEENLEEYINKHIDEKGVLYLRFGKQGLMERKLVFSESDSIKMKLKLQPSYRAGDRSPDSWLALMKSQNWGV